MEPFTRITATAVPLDMSNVNTDQIFPARFIRKPRAVGYAQFTFHDVRRSADGSLRPDFPLNEAGRISAAAHRERAPFTL